MSKDDLIKAILTMAMYNIVGGLAIQLQKRF